MRTRSHFRSTGTIAVLAAMTMTLSGCWMFGTGGAGETDEDPCSWIGQVLGGGEAAAETVVMVDLSASVWTSESGQIPDYPRIVRELALEHFHEEGDRTFTLGLFSGDASGIRFPVRGAPLARPLDQRQDEQVDGIGDCVTGALEEALEETPVSPGSDILAAIAAGSRNLTGAGTATLAIVTDGHSNVGCLDMNRILAETDVEGLEESCGSEWPTDIPDGVGLSLVGVSGAGVQVTGERSGAQVLGEIRAMWNRVGEHLTGAPGEYAREAVHEWIDAPDRDLPDDPPVIIRGDAGEALVIEAEALFDTDSAKLRRAARGSIDTVLESYGDVLDRSLPMTVTGHTDSRGDDAYNVELSTRRAEAVREHLLSVGFTDVSAIGRGSTEPVCDDRPDGNFDGACGRLNRRVEIRFGQE